MVDVRTVAKYLGAFGGGVVVAGFFLSGPVERPGEAQTHIPPPAVQSPATTGQGVSPAAPQASAPAAPSTSSAQARQPTDVTIEPRSVRTIPVRRPNEPERATAGTGDPERAPTEPEPAAQDNRPSARDASAQGARCDVSYCSRKYRSFDAATCTYRPYGGGSPRLCDR